SALLDRAVDAVARRGARELFLEVRETNLEAQHIYRRKGFAVIGRRRAYYSAPLEDALVMRLPVLTGV
ncbi:MAG TPA: GNAT family N-acetyltransferase, partial [Longimicrobiaceae bacterium]|nr:GNAT family N-acetyltransferase [Longimicrobiaceae bacterium]